MQENDFEDGDLLAEFCDESMDLLQGLPEQLTQFEQDPTESGPINAVFRAVHTVKGNAGFFGIPTVKKFAHAIEDTLDEIRQGNVSLFPDLTRVLIQGFDLLTEMVTQLQSGNTEVQESNEQELLLSQIATLCEQSRQGMGEDRLKKEINLLAAEIRDSDAAQAGDWSKRLLRLIMEPEADEPARTPLDAATAVSTAKAEAVDEKVPDKKTGEKSKQNRFLRVREDRIDEFLEYVSNLFITCERLKDLHSRMSECWQANELIDELRQINATFSRQSTLLQRGVVELRKVPVSGLLSKFPRVARSLAAKLGKQLDVHLDGCEIEIEKSLVEDLDGPLMHMVRNVCDHGIETPAERESRGVEPTGNLWMKCSLSNTHVIITVRDDGRGIDPNRLRKKAIESGMFREEEAHRMSDAEAIDLVFCPGLSTAEAITDVSGRGVGLDVVRERIRDHAGDIVVQSKVGEGTQFELKIPIRRAVVVVDGLLVQQGPTTFVIPFEQTREIYRVRGREMSHVQSRPVACVRGVPYPVYRLAELLEIDRKPTQVEPDQIYDGVLVGDRSKSILLVMDAIVGHRKVVVSDLSGIFPCTDRISGVAQLGGNKLALVLNIGNVVQSTGDVGLRRKLAPQPALANV